MTYADVCFRMQVRQADWDLISSLEKGANNAADAAAKAQVCCRILTYAHVCWRMLTYAGVCWHTWRRVRIMRLMLLPRPRYADVCWTYAHVCSRMLAYAGVPGEGCEKFRSGLPRASTRV